MALQLALTESENNPSAYDITLTDSTGLYTVNTSTGYGSPNLNRSDLKLFIKSWHVDSGLVETKLIPESYSTTTATGFTYKSIKDGWKKHYVIGVDIRATVPSDSAVNTVLDAMTSTQMDALVNGGFLSIGGTSYTIYITAYQTFPVPKAKIDKWEANEQLNLALYECSETIAQKRLLFESIFYPLIGAVYDFQRGNKLQAQIDIEKINTKGDELYAET